MYFHATNWHGLQITFPPDLPAAGIYSSMVCAWNFGSDSPFVFRLVITIVLDAPVTWLESREFGALVHWSCSSPSFFACTVGLDDHSKNGYPNNTACKQSTYLPESLNKVSDWLGEYGNNAQKLKHNKCDSRSPARFVHYQQCRTIFNSIISKYSADHIFLLSYDLYVDQWTAIGAISFLFSQSQ
jgi:hypothetical protein